MARLGVALIHGLGNQTNNLIERALKELNECIRHHGYDTNSICWKPISWCASLENYREERWQRLAVSGKLNWEWIRKDIVTSGLGEAFVYAGSAVNNSTIYDIVHELIGKNLTELRDSLEKKDRAPLVIMAHSFAGVIISNYLWDIQIGSKIPFNTTTPFAGGDTLSGMITFGCNIPLFTTSHDVTEIKPIEFPGPNAKDCFPRKTAADLANKLVWNNFYDIDDVLGFPLKPINSAYFDTINKDIVIHSNSPNGTHFNYWMNKEFCKIAAFQLIEILTLLES